MKSKTSWKDSIQTFGRSLLLPIALLPVFVLGVAAPISPRVARWLTPWKSIFWFQLLSVAGIFWRSWDGVAGLYGGRVLMGLGMGIAGAAIPGRIKHQFPDHASAMMGIYSAMIGVGSAVASLSLIHISRKRSFSPHPWRWTQNGAACPGIPCSARR